jgi:hypothetical protein
MSEFPIFRLNCSRLKRLPLLAGTLPNHLPLALFIVWASIATAQTSSRFIVRIYEADINLVNGGLTVHDCGVVFPDGKIHLELRRQQLPQRTASLTVYDQRLSKEQFNALAAILQDDRIRQLPAFEQPSRPFVVPHFQGFNATVQWDDGAQVVGFFATGGDEEDKMPLSPRTDQEKEMIEHWKQSKTSLRPLIDWFNAMRPSQASKSSQTSKLCISDDNDLQR